MRKYWLLLAAGVLAALFAIGAVACDDDENGGDATPTQPAGGEEPSATEPAGDIETPTTEDGGAAGETIDVTLAEVSGSGVTGSATLTPTDAGGTDVEVTIDGGLEEGSHLSHIHTGTCASPGNPETTLTNVEADATGAGSATTNLTEAPSDFTDGNHYIAVHDLAAAVVTCGDIPAAG
jgi:hypothetical protein